MPLFLARASARGIIIILHLAIGAPAESLERGAWGFLGSVDEGIARMELANRSKEGLGFYDIYGRRKRKSGVVSLAFPYRAP